MRRSTTGRVGAALTGATAMALGTVLVTAPMATAGGGDTQRVRMKDDCEPTSFNAAIGPGTCVGDGDTTFDDFLAQLAENGMEANKSADDWRFQPEEFHIDVGDRLMVVNLGGELHTFTKVTRFGAGCIKELNAALGVNDVVKECLKFPQLVRSTGVPAGGTRYVHGLKAGTHKFECLIHPWMQSVVTVRADDDHSGHH